jgi:hypothetical protein
MGPSKVILVVAVLAGLGLELAAWTTYRSGQGEFDRGVAQAYTMAALLEPRPRDSIVAGRPDPLDSAAPTPELRAYVDSLRDQAEVMRSERAQALLERQSYFEQMTILQWRSAMRSAFEMALIGCALLLGPAVAVGRRRSLPKTGEASA